MCTTSCVGDKYRETFPGAHPWVVPVTPSPPYPAAGTSVQFDFTKPTRAEFDALKDEVEALRELLLAAKDFDTKTGQPDCEVDEKVEFIRQVAEFVGVDMADVFGRGDE